MISIILVLLLAIASGLLSNSLIVLVVSGIILALSFRFRNMFKKAYIFYILGVIISATSLYFHEIKYFDIVTNGLIGYGLILVVMFTGVFPNKWFISKRLKLNRGVFSILSFIMISPHALGHIFKILGGVNLFGIVAYAIMIPLTLISFKVIRKEINPKEWRNIQKAAYLIYVTLFTHLIYVSAWENRVVYVVIAVLYLNNKIIKELKR